MAAGAAPAASDTGAWCLPQVFALFVVLTYQKVRPYFPLNLFNYFTAGFPTATLVLPVPARGFDQTLVRRLPRVTSKSV